MNLIIKNHMKKRHHVQLMLSMMLVGVLSACGGSGSSTGNPQTPDTPSVDDPSDPPTIPETPAKKWNYAGIPYPSDWPFDPVDVKRPTPAEWPAAASNNHFYVAPEHPNATDTPDDGEITGEFGRFGYPDKPRKTFPTRGWIGDTFTAGTVIVLSGGTYSADSFYRTYSPRFKGTESQPIFVSGDAANPPKFTSTHLNPYDSQYVILENIHWTGGNTENNVLTLNRDRSGDTHHVVLRHLRFEDVAYVAGNGAIVGLAASNRGGGAALHDVVAYNNVFKNCGTGYDWATKDGDHHGYKVEGFADGYGYEGSNDHKAYRIWVIDNQALTGDTPDPVDGRYKSLSGNLVQVGDQAQSSGGAHHVFIGGNYQSQGRQALAWTKKSSDVIFSTNTCEKTYSLAGGNGQCFGTQYDAKWHWAIANTASDSAAGWMHTSGDVEGGPYYVMGNLFHNMQTATANDGYRRNAGVSLWNAFGEHVIANNTFVNVDYGVWANTARTNAQSSLHMYNNIIDITPNSGDRQSTPITTGYNGSYSAQNNLLARFAPVRFFGQVYDSLEGFNAVDGVSGNVVADPSFTSESDYTPLVTSPAYNAGTMTPTVDAYQAFIDRYKDDPYFPGNPVDVIHKDLLGNARDVGKRDIGAVENTQ